MLSWCSVDFLRRMRSCFEKKKRERGKDQTIIKIIEMEAYRRKEEDFQRRRNTKKQKEKSRRRGRWKVKKIGRIEKDAKEPKGGRGGPFI